MSSASLRDNFNSEFITKKVFRVSLFSTAQLRDKPWAITLSATLFILKINSIADLIPPDSEKLLFVDGFYCSYSYRNMTFYKKETSTMSQQNRTMGR